LIGQVDVVPWLLMFAVPSEPDAAQIQTTRKAHIREKTKISTLGLVWMS
jgi:hypothetical protein